MERNNTGTQLFVYTLSVVMLAISANINFDVIRYYFAQNSVLQNYSDFVYFDRVWSAIIATTVLLFVYHKFTAKKIIITLALIYIFAQVNIILSINENMIRLYYFLLTASGFALFVFISSLMLIETNIREEMNLAIFFSTLVLGFLLSELINYFLLSTINSKTLNRMMGLNILPMVMVVFILALNGKIRINKRRPLPDFLLAFKFSELEIGVNFSLFFAFMVLYEGRDVLATSDSFMGFSANVMWYYFCVAMLLLIYPITYYGKKIPIHILNISCLAILLVCFSLLNFWIDYSFLGLFMWVIVALSMYLLFVSNNMILFEKFVLKEIFGILMLCFFAGAVGLYAGHVAVTSIEPSFRESALHLPISIVIGTIFVYYVFRFVRDKS